MVTICKKCIHHKDWSPEAYGFYSMISDFCFAPKGISFVSGHSRWDLTACEKNNGKCPDFKPKEDSDTVVLWVGVEMPEPVKPAKPMVVKRQVGNGQAALIAISFGLGVGVTILILNCLIATSLVQGLLQ